MQETLPIDTPALETTPSPGTAFVLGLQHVLVMYAGNIAVPLIVSAALKLPPNQTAFLINASLFAAGIVTVVQSLGIWKFGVRLPVMMGASFLTVAPMIAMGLDPSIGIRGFYGALIVSGIAGILIAPFAGKVLKLFPPVVCGSLVTLLGISLLSVAIDWAGGGPQTVTRTAGGKAFPVANPGYGAPQGLAIALFVLLLILVVNRYAKGVWSRLAVILGICGGTLLSAALGKVHIQGAEDAPWIAFISPMHFGRPTFSLAAIITMCIVMLIIFVESTAVFLALSDITGRPLRTEALTAGLRADGLGIAVGGLLGVFPFTSFSQNVGLVSVTGVRSRYVCVAGGAILMVLGVLPKLAHAVAAIPVVVLGGAGIAMFGSVAASGIKLLGSVDFERSRHNLLIVALSLGIGLTPTLAPNLFQYLPAWSIPITQSGVILGTIVAVLLNLLFRGLDRREV
jgi:NCS2 family nucleobase:cation symporter-2